MHLLARDAAGIDEQESAVDLAQSPGEIVYLSFSDSDLGAAAAVHARGAGVWPSLRLASLARLRHPYSVDLYLEKTAAHAKFIFVRCLGGADYWRYGVDELAALCRAKGIALAIVPGDFREDVRLDRASTLPMEDLRRLYGFAQEGGPDNLAALFSFIATRIGRAMPWGEPQPLPAAGRAEVLCRGGGADSLPPCGGGLGWEVAQSGEFARLPSRAPCEISRPPSPPHKGEGGSEPRALIVFYRSHWLAGDFAPLEVLADALYSRGFAVEAIFVSSLKDPAAEAVVADSILRVKPDIVLNATAFSARGEGAGVLDRADAPVLQLSFGLSSREAWAASPRGIGAADLAMNVVLPEVDGRIPGPFISFKAEAAADEALGYARVLHRAETDRIAAAADLAANWARLRRKSREARRIALVLSDYPARSGAQGFAVGLDTPASVVAIAERLRAEGYRVGDVPAADELMAALLKPVIASRRVAPEARPMTGSAKQSRSRDPALDCFVAPLLAMTVDEYAPLFAALPASFRDAVTAAWGAPQDDPLCIDGAFRFPAIDAGNLTIAIQPDRGRRDARRDDYHDVTLPPRHSYVGFYLALREKFRIDAMIHLGTHGTLEWLPGKSVALSGECAPAILTGGLPVIYPFIVNDPGEAAQARRRIGAVTVGHMTPPLVETELAGAAHEIEGLLDEYSAASGLDPRRAKVVADAILDRALASGLAAECGVDAATSREDSLVKLDAWLCDIKELRVGDGLHVFGAAEGEWNGLLAALDGRFVEPGPSGAPSRMRADVLPTGRNLYSADPRAIPTRTAWEIGSRTAADVLARHAQEHGDWPRALMIDLWGSATMRTGGEDFAQALALIGARPVWDNSSARVSGFEIMSPAELGRPRIDVTLRISGLFRDVFPAQIALFDQAVRAIAARDEDAETNPLAAQARNGGDIARIFGGAPQIYGVGLADAVATDSWGERADLGALYLDSGAYAYSGVTSEHAREKFAERVGATDALVHVQDMAETDILAGGAFAEHEGGFLAANAALGGAAQAFHVDATRSDRARVRTTSEEIARVVRGRLSSPRWLEGQMRHGFRGATEIAEGVSNLVAFAAAAPVVDDSLFDLTYDSTLGDERVRAFLQDANPQAAQRMARDFAMALRRGLWRSRRNSLALHLDARRPDDGAGA
jgi:cobaltochelatase CobN